MNQSQVSFRGAVIIISYLVVAMAISVLWLGIPMHVTMLSALGVAFMVLLQEKYPFEEIIKGIEYGGKIAILPVMILIIIGTVMGSWIASGTVPLIIYWGLKLISPSMFLVTTCLVCMVTSLATGSSWSTGGTVGVALMGVGIGLGINPAMTAGAVVSGAFFGDKMSPLSDTTNLAPGLAEADLFDHIKAMAYTTIPGIGIALVLYGVLGMKYAGAAVNADAINNTLIALDQTFKLSPVVLLPAVYVVYAGVRKKSAFTTLLISSLIASMIAIVMQGETITSITTIMDSGFKSSTGIADIDKLLSRGGLQNMMWTSSLALIAISYGGILERSGVLQVLLDSAKNLIRTTGSLVATTIGSLIGLNLVTGSQYLSIIISGRMFVPAYKEKELLPQVLSRTLEDAGTLTSVLVPWNLCGVFFASTLGVSTLAYAPYAFLNWMVPIIAIIYAKLNLFVWKTGDIESRKVYSTN